MGDITEPVAHAGGDCHAAGRSRVQVPRNATIRSEPTRKRMGRPFRARRSSACGIGMLIGALVTACQALPPAPSAAPRIWDVHAARFVSESELVADLAP